ncbi:MAG: hypothetical protein NWF05_00175 [Candidatus Bathyarchaeota archaeon]|nr:hypothetical protein [Candidatus Bathyarchaeota archaeon]
MSWGNSVILQAHEKIVNTWKGVWITKEETLPEKNTGQKVREVLKQRKKGYLVLTNHRILFIDEEQTMLSMSLKEFAETWMEKTPTEIESPKKMETYVFQLSNVGKKEFDKFREQVIYFSQKV